MTKLDNGKIVTEIDAGDHNATLTAQGYSIHHIEDWHDHGSYILWDAPRITEADLPY